MADFTNIYPPVGGQLWTVLLMLSGCLLILAGLIILFIYLIIRNRKKSPTLVKKELPNLKNNALLQIQKIRQVIETSSEKEIPEKIHEASVITRTYLDDLKSLKAQYKTKKELKILNDSELNEILNKFYELEFSTKPHTKQDALKSIDELIVLINKWN